MNGLKFPLKAIWLPCQCHATMPANVSRCPVFVFTLAAFQPRETPSQKWVGISLQTQYLPRSVMILVNFQNKSPFKKKKR